MVFVKTCIQWNRNLVCPSLSDDALLFVAATSVVRLVTLLVIAPQLVMEVAVAVAVGVVTEVEAAMAGAAGDMTEICVLELGVSLLTPAD
jgi:hypothetical protein